jgi:putative ABC transport system permease protein
MLKNYLTIALRNLMKYKFISFINLFGLTVGLTCCLLILNYIRHELSYDTYHPDADRIYRVTRIFNNPQTGAVSLHLGTIAPPFAPLLKNDFQEIEQISRFIDFSPLPALTGPFSVMLSEKMAKKYFGDEDPMDKMVRMDSRFNLKVTGIFKAFPANTHFHPEFLISFNTLNDTAVYGAENLRTNWGNNSFFTYIKVPDGFDPKNMEARFPAFIDKHMPVGGQPQFKRSQGTSLTLQKLTDIHLHSHLDYEAEENGDIKRVYIFSAIAFFILLIA